MSRLDVASQVRQPPFQSVQGAVDYKWKFVAGHEPSQEYSDEDPPILLSDRPDEIAIDGMLGLYTPSAQQITIFRKGISWASEILKVSHEDLAQIVKMHEWSHALLHLGLQETDYMSVLRDESQWGKRVPQMNTWFNSLDANLHETLAQLVTRESLRWLRHQATIPAAKEAIDQIEDVFKQLMQRAPFAYRVEKYEQVTKDRFINSVRLLKNGGLVGADAWETVVTW